MPTRILILSDGGSIHTRRWCAYFISQGYETGLFSLEPISIDTNARKFQGKRPTGRGIIDYSLARNHLGRIVKEFKPDIINAHFVNSYGWLASHVDYCPVVVTAWGSDVLLLPEKSLIHRRRIARALKHAAICTVDGDNLYDAVKKYLSEDKITRINMGVDADLYESGRRAEFESDIISIIAPRGLQPVYDPNTLISAIGLLQNRINIRATLRGDGALAEQYQKIINQKQLGDKITIRKRLSHAGYIELLCRHQIFISTSLSDSTSVALLEAMTVGLYPIVTDIPGNREWITSGENGILFEPENSAGLADAIEQAIANRRSFAEVAIRNRKRIEQDGLWQTNMDKLSAKIDGLMA